MAEPTVTHVRRGPTATAGDLPDLEMTLTLAEWHRYRDTDDRWIVVPHDPQLQAA